MPKTALSSLISSTTKQKLIPAIVIDVLGKRCSVKLGGSGNIIHNLPFVGPAPVAGDAVRVNFLGRKPTVEIASRTAQNYSTITNSLVATKQSIPAPLETPPQSNRHNDLAGLEGGLEVADSVTAEYYHLSEDQNADVEAIDALTPLYGFLRKTADNEWALDFQIPEGYYLQVGNRLSYPTLSNILLGDQSVIYEKYDDCIAISIDTNYTIVDGVLTRTATKDGLVVGWDATYSNWLAKFGDIDGEDHGYFLDIDLAGGHFNSPLSTLGRRSASIVVTENYDATIYDEVILCDSSSPITVTILDGIGSKQNLTIKNIGSGQVTCSKVGNTIDNQAEQFLDKFDSISIIDYATSKWSILSLYRAYYSS